MPIRKLRSNAFLYEMEDPLVLECGETLQDLKIHYHTYGSLNADKSNVVWVFHALTGNSDPLDWWGGFIGSEALINPESHFIVCANMIGSCYGSTKPKDFNFPLITISDIVQGFKKLKRKLEIEEILIGIGCSMGGQVLLEWAVQVPSLFKTIVPIATNAVHSPWGIAFNETQRMAIEADIEKGIETARAIGMLSYRHYNTYNETQKDLDNRSDNFSASSYQKYQGKKLRKRFCPYSYYALSKTMDSQNIGRHFESSEAALQRINSKVIAIGVDTDILFPCEEQKFIARHARNGFYHEVSSRYGHDGFLIEFDQLTKILEKTLV